MILIMFILLLLALSPLICRQISTAFTHAHTAIPIYSPRRPADDQVVSCSSAFPMFATAEKRSFFFGYAVQNGQSARCGVVVYANVAATLYTSLPAL
ncbi:MAG: hypothetical protein M3Y39_12630 [Chloroflexota bacterium]|nr:hypothetical protein [Chloroflexota bacterium]